MCEHSALGDVLSEYKSSMNGAVPPSRRFPSIIHPSVCPSSACQSARPSVCPSVHTPIRSSIHSIHLWQTKRRAYPLMTWLHKLQRRRQWQLQVLWRTGRRMHSANCWRCAANLLTRLPWPAKKHPAKALDVARKGRGAADVQVRGHVPRVPLWRTAATAPPLPMHRLPHVHVGIAGASPSGRAGQAAGSRPAVQGPGIYGGGVFGYVRL